MKKKRNILFHLSVVIGVLYTVIGCCKKDPGPDPVNVTDIEGNVYNVVRIGKQLWMKENLKTKKLNDGTFISNVTDSTIWWKSTSTPAYCWYNNDSSTNKSTYGALYNSFSVNTGKLCPTNWHVPSDEEWTELTTYLGDANNAGGKLKETGTTHWKSPNTGATNVNGFTALPGGLREQVHGTFDEIGFNGYWWSRTLGEAGLWMGTQTYGPIHYYLDYMTSSLNKVATPRHYYLGMNQGNSVRCVRD